MIYPDSIAMIRAIEALNNKPAPTLVFDSGVRFTPGCLLVPNGAQILALTDASVQSNWHPLNMLGLDAINAPTMLLDEDASLRRLYAEFEAEDVALADEGLAEYLRILDSAEKE